MKKKLSAALAISILSVGIIPVVVKNIDSTKYENDIISEDEPQLENNLLNVSNLNNEINIEFVENQPIDKFVYAIQEDNEISEILDTFDWRI